MCAARRTIERRIARNDPSLRATLTGLAPLLYAAGAASTDDRPAHVRAASAIRRHGPSGLLIVQDDANILALHGADGRVSAMLLPRGAGGRRLFGDEHGNKQAKMDLEACITLPDRRAVAFGSGSTRAREHLVVLSNGEVRLKAATDLYERLRAETAFSGSELNIEGALLVGDVVRLFQRGNGAPRGELLPVNATADLPLLDFVHWLDDDGALPALDNIVEYDLGTVGSARFGFTDAALVTGGVVVFVACAEASPDTYSDGEVYGCRLGVIDDAGVRMTDVVDAAGRPVPLKLEGIEWNPDDGAFDVVADMDRPDEPAELGRLIVTGLDRSS